MSKRFENLKKIPEQPAKRLLAAGNAKLKTELKAPASAAVPVVLAELEAAEAWVDMLRLLSVALPPREAVWWACLAGRDLLGDAEPTPCLAAAEAWVFEPNEANRAKVQAAMDSAETGDKTAHCATAAYYATGDLGPGEMKDLPAPPGIVGACAFGINLKSLKCRKDPQEQFQLMIDRGLNIARGGNGKVKPAAAEAASGAETTKGAS